LRPKPQTRTISVRVWCKGRKRALAIAINDKQREELKKLFPTFSDKELELAAERLDDYLKLAWGDLGGQPTV
jgi:hypothetical protein